MSTWLWPAPGNSNITSGHGSRWGSSHSGIDISAGKDSPVIASREGKISYASINCEHNYGKKVGVDSCGNTYGNYITIDHGDGYTTRYAHLTSILVSVGDEVSAGQPIGTVGSTGNSTGFHLHFEVRYNNSIKDPEEYVSPSGPTIVNDSLLDGIDQSYYRVVEAGGTTIGQRVSGLSKEPLHAFVNIYVGGNQLLLSTEPPKPNIITAFEYNRLDGAGETAIITLFDDNWEELERVFSAHWNNIYIEYGYPDGIKSKLHKHMIQNYNLRFYSTGTQLSIETVTEGVYLNLKPRSITLDTYNPTEAVKKICESLGYEIIDEYFDSSDDIEADNAFNLVENYPITYIKDTIIPQASKEGQELFSFWIDSENKPHFKREGYRYDTSPTDNTTRTDTLRTYIYQKGYDSNVIDFEVDIKGIFGGSGSFQVATETRSTVFDTKTKNQESYTANKSSTITAATGDTTHTKSDQSSLVVDAAGNSPSQVKNQVWYNMKSLVNDAYEATLTIVGDPTISIHEYIRVINMTDEGYLHHTSGVYFISGITDSIENGHMVTVLKLIKNATAGNIDGVEIINPKTMIK